MNDLSEFLSDEPLHRAAEVVDLDALKGIVHARMVPYEREIQLYDDLYETFARDSLIGATKVPKRVKVTDQQHNSMVVIGHAVAIRNEPDGLYADLQIADTTAGRDTLVLIRDGFLDEMSIEFRALAKHMKVTRDANGATHIRHERALLLGVSPVSHGAYGQGAKVLNVRAQQILDHEESEREAAAIAAAADLATRREAELKSLRALGS